MSWNESCGETPYAHILSQVLKDSHTDIPLFLLQKFSIRPQEVLTALVCSSATEGTMVVFPRFSTVFNTYVTNAVDHHNFSSLNISCKES